MDARGPQTVEDALLRTLAGWSGASIVGGAVLMAAGRRSGRPAVAAFGRQQAGWGAVDGAVAATGLLRRSSGSEPTEPARLRRLLLVNSALDVGYVAAGALLVALRDRFAGGTRYSPQEALGDGLGIALQGGFLLVLDSTFARRLRRGHIDPPAGPGSLATVAPEEEP